jgi:hypothetical protein
MSANIIRFPAMLTNEDGRIQYGCYLWRTTKSVIDAMTPTDYRRAWQWEQQRSAWERHHKGGGKSDSQTGNGAA